MPDHNEQPTTNNEQKTNMNNQTILQPNAQKATDIRSALANAGLNWEVEKRSIFVAGKDNLGFSDSFKEIPNQYATVRTDTQEVLGIVGSKYHIIQNENAFAILDDIIRERTAAGKECKYDSVVTGDGGRRVAVTVDFGKFEVVPGDVNQSYLTAVTSHDGSAATRFMWLSFRFACFNAFRRALKKVRGTDDTTTVRHTASHGNRLNIARRVIQSTGYTQDNIAGVLRDLASRQLRQNEIKLGIERLFPYQVKEDGETPERIERKRQKVLELFEYNDNNAVPAIRGTAYNLFNAYTEFVDHYEPVVRTQARKGMTDTRIRQERAFFGTGADAKERALDIITDLSLN